MQGRATVRVRQRGTIVVPARIRQRLGLEKDSRVLLIEEEDRLILKPVSSFTDMLAGVTKGCFGTSREEVDEWVERERTER